MSFDIAKNEDLKLLPLSNFDSQYIAKLYALIWRDGPYNEIWTEDSAYEAVVSMGDSLLIATYDETIVGFIAGSTFIQSIEEHPDFFCATSAIKSLGLDLNKLDYLAELAVLPSYRGRGYGASLLQNYIKYALAQGREGIILRTHASDDNPALPLYRKLGFTYLVDQGGKPLTTEVRHPRLGDISDVDYRPFHILKF